MAGQLAHIGASLSAMMTSVHIMLLHEVQSVVRRQLNENSALA